MNTVHAFSNGQPIMTQPLLPLIQELPEAGRATVGTSFPIAARGKFIKQFTGPDADSGVVCFKFWQLVHASGCPYQCAYCFLQTTTFFRFNKEALMGLIYSNWKKMITEVEEWLTSPVPRMLIVGELQDGLAFDSAYAGVTGKPLTHHLIPLFASQNRHRLIFLTKSTLTRNALKLPPTRQVVFSWSVNAEFAARRWELGTPPPSRRFAAASKMQRAGWPIRFRLDPMIPYVAESETWRDGYSVAIDRINALSPEMVTIGALARVRGDWRPQPRRITGLPTCLTTCRRKIRPVLSTGYPSISRWKCTVLPSIDWTAAKSRRRSARKISQCGKPLVWNSSGVTAY